MEYSGICVSEVRAASADVPLYNRLSAERFCLPCSTRVEDRVCIRVLPLLHAALPIQNRSYYTLLPLVHRLFAFRFQAEI